MPFGRASTFPYKKAESPLHGSPDARTLENCWNQEETMKCKFLAPLSLTGSVVALLFSQADYVSSQVSTQAFGVFRASDPGVRGGAAGAGGPIAGLDSPVFRGEVAL